jgi:hypothetical protein
MKFAASTVMTLWMTGMAATVHAEPITYLFVQTGATVPWLNLHASITLEDPSGGVPTLSCTLSAGQYSPPCPIDDFGNILTLTFDRGAALGSHYSLFDFHTSNPGPFPFAFLDWSISPTLIYFNNSLDQFFIYGAGTAGAGSIRLNSDLGTCSTGVPPTDLCIATGAWTPVPEPPTAIAIALGILGFSWLQFRAHRKRFMRS